MIRSIIVTSLVLLLALGCSASASPSYAGGLSSCAKFQELLPQVSQGILTNAEVREKIKAIQSRASTAEPAIRDASNALLRAVTPFDADQFLIGIESMVQSCEESGYFDR